MREALWWLLHRCSYQPPFSIFRGFVAVHTYGRKSLAFLLVLSQNILMDTPRDSDRPSWCGFGTSPPGTGSSFRLSNQVYLSKDNGFLTQYSTWMFFLLYDKQFFPYSDHLSFFSNEIQNLNIYIYRMVRRPCKLQRDEQRRQDLCWKDHDPAQPLVLHL